MLEKKGSVRIFGKSKIDMETLSGDMTLFSRKDMNLKAPKGSVKAQGTIKHKNLTVIA